MLKKLAHLIFYSNYFYGVCTVSLAIETNFQLNTALNSFLFYLLLFLGTVVYYTYAYIGDTASGHYYNNRSAWYANHKKFIRYNQIIFSLAAIVTGAFLFIKNFNGILHLKAIQWACIVFFPFVAALYYGIVLSPAFKLNLRRQGWLKPFVIGFVWAGVVTIYPVIYRQIEAGTQHTISLYDGWFFLKNFMFITVLCIMFDIKDYAADHNRRLKTFVVRAGLRKTIFYIIIPLTLIGLASFLIFAWAAHFPALRILINTIPFILLIIVAYSLHERKPILYYLAVIDGLMLVKAVCGITGIVLVK